MFILKSRFGSPRGLGHTTYQLTLCSEEELIQWCFCTSVSTICYRVVKAVSLSCSPPPLPPALLHAFPWEQRTGGGDAGTNSNTRGKHPRNAAAGPRSSCPSRAATQQEPPFLPLHQHLLPCLGAVFSPGTPVMPTAQPTPPGISGCLSFTVLTILNFVKYFWLVKLFP